MIRHTLGLCLLLPALLASVAARADDAYPLANKPITIIVPFAAGSGTDAITRVIAEKMAASLKASIVIDNKAGASGQIGTEFVARAKPDGYTLLVGTNSTHSGNQYLFKSLRYDPLRDFAPIGRMTINPLALLVKHDAPFRSAADLVAYMKANPGKASYGYGNTGGQVSGGMLVYMADAKAVAVPYKSTPQAFTDLMGGQIDFTFVDFAASRQLIDGGKLRALAITSPKRFNVARDIPTVAETPGFSDFSLFAWLGMFAPAGTPEAAITKLNAALRTALETPEVRNTLEQQMGSVVEPTSVAEFRAFMQEQSEIWKRRVREAGMKPE
ncbi:MAG: tripartite tricarboxylate transporter substrate binding protein [Burkholderiales bacterium]|nr:tripartite tricarboxylate transporter substrate binding protein [Burkholderiales bacterium]